MSTTVLQKLESYGVVPVIAIESADSALSLADALIEGGLPVAEITFRTAAAADVISLLASKRPEIILGAGTVLTPENLRRAKDCGATFAVAPGFNPDVVNTAREIDLPFVPGINNPTDIEGALALGCRHLKFFPAEASGGIKYLNAIAAPYKHTGVKFMPTGGINIDNLADYLSLDIIAACGGTWIAKKPDIAEGLWSDIARRCRQVAEVVNKVK